ATGLNQGDTVTRGQLIGYVGDTGDPGPGNYHLHFEVHPKGGAAVDPYPLLAIPKACTIYP
ncbi:MAG: peptidoglycan LD-endopeptidase LytH, partial [Ilumatobacteraceae bacterium]|nr:peptidoglycan LD-endopeptidase LytH [Ilumatobacteraceae bacterium]